jgi:hypothetical protein
MHDGRKTRIELCEDIIVEKMLEISRLNKELAEMTRKYRNACEHIENIENSGKLLDTPQGSEV